MDKRSDKAKRDSDKAYSKLFKFKNRALQSVNFKPNHINTVRVFNLRKEPGFYKGTIYLGQRSQHGFLKIYDKAKEQDIQEIPLTRIEHTLDADKTLSLEKINIINTKRTDAKPELDRLNNCIVMRCLALQTNGIDFEPFISTLNYRRRKTIEPYLYEKAINSKINNVFKGVQTV